MVKKIKTFFGLRSAFHGVLFGLGVLAVFLVSFLVVRAASSVFNASTTPTYDNITDNILTKTEWTAAVNRMFWKSNDKTWSWLNLDHKDFIHTDASLEIDGAILFDADTDRYDAAISDSACGSDQAGMFAYYEAGSCFVGCDGDTWKAIPRGSCDKTIGSEHGSCGRYNGKSFISNASFEAAKTNNNMFCEAGSLKWPCEGVNCADEVNLDNYQVAFNKNYSTNLSLLSLLIPSTYASSAAIDNKSIPLINKKSWKCVGSVSTSICEANIIELKNGECGGLDIEEVVVPSTIVSEWGNKIPTDAGKDGIKAFCEEGRPFMSSFLPDSVWCDTSNGSQCFLDSYYCHWNCYGYNGGTSETCTVAVAGSNILSDLTCPS